MKILPFILLLTSLFGSVACTTKQADEPSPFPESCRINCESTYGSLLGVSPAGVEAYSNCNSSCVIFEPNRYNQIYTGIKWQCVEYARRWLLHELGVVYGDVNIAADIWVLDQVNDPLSEMDYTFASHVNGDLSAPQRGDLLIYGKEFLGTGHVAVVVAVDKDKELLKVAEQNYANTLWENKYAREIKYLKKDNQIWVLDSHLIGWKRVNK